MQLGRAMKNYIIMLMLTAPVLFTAHASHAAQTDSWEEDLRRCMIYKAIDSGRRVVIANDEGALEIEVQREDSDNTEEAVKTYIVTFDNRTPSPPMNAVEGIYPHKLGTYATIAPVFAKARTMKISITAPDEPEDTVTVHIGNGAKAMAFLKKCNDYWRRYNNKRR
jgi:hypothetical protein